MDNRKGILLVLLSALMFGSYGIWSKLIGNSFGAFFQGWTRGLIIVIALLPILLWKKELIAIPKKDWKWLSIFLVFTSLTQAPLFYAFNHMDIGTATLLFFVSMLLTMYIFGFLFYKEKLTKVKIAAFILAIVGICLVFSFSLIYFTLFAALMAILNGITSGGEISSSKKLSKKYSALYLSWLSWLIIWLTNLPVSLLLGEAQVFPSLSLAWLYQICFVIVSLVGFWAVMEGFKYLESSVGGLVGLVEIVFSITLGILIFHETLKTKIVLGAVLILLASALPHISAIMDKQKKKARKKTKKS